MPLPVSLYRVVPEDELAEAERAGTFSGSEHDRRDGFIHLSAAHQVAGTLARHYAGRSGLVLLVLDPSRFGAARLEWEVSRGGDRFPHLYGAFPMKAVREVLPLVLGPEGMHTLPELS